MRYIAYACCNVKYHICDMQHLQNAYAIYRKCDMQHLPNAYALFIALIMTYMILNFICYEVWENCFFQFIPYEN